MRKRASPPSSLPSPSMVDSSASSPSSSSSSYSSCVVDFDDHNNNHNRQSDDEMKPPKPKRARRKRVSINTNDKPKVEAEAEANANANANANAIAPINRRSSIYRGVTRHRWTGRFEAHLWDKSSWNSLHNKKGRQVYLGAYDSEVDAARTYDLAALKYWGPDTTLNFPIENYSKELQEMENVPRAAYLSKLRRRSNGFSRGVSKYRGVARHHHNGRWEARIGRVLGNKYLYLGTFSSQEEAAAAYDLAAIEYRGPNAVTNFDISNYIGRVKNLMPKDQSQPPSPSETKPEQQQEEPQIKQQKEEEQQHEHKQELKQQCLQEAKQREQMALSSELEESKLISSINHSSLLEMDPVDDHRENPWSFCLDSGGYDPHLVPDIPLEEDGKLLDMFDQVGFEDDIDLIFEGEGKSITKGDLGCQTEIKASMDMDKKMENALSFSLSSSSSPASTSSLVSC